MEKVNVVEIKNKLIKTIDKIFFNCNLENISEYEKRKMVFEYLCSTLNYDYDLLSEIRDNSEGKKRIVRDLRSELLNVFDNNRGVCNAISQYYKLLLEELGIISYCVICDDGTTVNHQLNLVYDSTNKSFSFDDITSVIVGRGTVVDYFDYDLLFANSVNQGNKVILDNMEWVILPEDYIDYLIGREKSTIVTLENLPENIKSVRDKHDFKF